MQVTFQRILTEHKMLLHDDSQFNLRHHNSCTWLSYEMSVSTTKVAGKVAIAAKSMITTAEWKDVLSQQNNLAITFQYFAQKKIWVPTCDHFGHY